MEIILLIFPIYKFFVFFLNIFSIWCCYCCVMSVNKDSSSFFFSSSSCSCIVSVLVCLLSSLTPNQFHMYVVERIFFHYERVEAIGIRRKFFVRQMSSLQMSIDWKRITNLIPMNKHGFLSLIFSLSTADEGKQLYCWITLVTDGIWIDRRESTRIFVFWGVFIP